MESGQEQLPPDPISQTCTIYKQAIDEISTADYTQLLRLIDESENLYICSSGMVQDAVANEMRRMFRRPTSGSIPSTAQARARSCWKT